MPTPNDLHGQIEATLSRLGALVTQRDMAALSEFAADAILVGSDAGEIAEGIEELRTLLLRVYAQAATISWEWETIRAAASGDVAWFFAKGYVVATGAEGQKRLPYRLAGVLQWQADRWIWRQFHGSEPVTLALMDSVPPTLPLRGVIFDLDGTLANTLPVCYAAFHAVFARFVPGRAFTDAEIAGYFGPDEEGVFRQLLPPKEWASALDAFLGEYAAHHDACPAPFAGIDAVLDLLHERKILTAVVTGKGAGSAAISLERLDLARRFDLVEAGSPTGAIKAQSIHKVLAAWGIAPEEAGAVAYVGDMPGDVTAAREAGLLPLSAAWAPTADAAALLAMRPAALFSSVDDFAVWLRNHSE